MPLGFNTSPPGIGSLAEVGAALVDSVIGDLLDTVTGGDGKFRALFKQDESNVKQYPDTPTDRRQWIGPTDHSSPEYFFLLKVGPKVVQIPFNVNPQREQINEPHAKTTVYTQGGGKIVQSEGNISNDITINGTCGLYPNQKGRKRLPDSGIGSGLEGFKFLQTVMRRYKFLKRYGNVGAGLQLIYVNRRSQESWVVEPGVFGSEDAVEHNLHPTYSIQLETLYPYDGADAKSLVERLFDAIPGYRDVDNIVQRASEAVDELNAAAGQVSAIVDGFLATVMRPVVSLTNSYADLVGGRLPNVANFKRDSVQSLVRSLTETGAALEGAGAPALAVKVYAAERRVRDLLLVDQAFDSTPQTKAVNVTATQRAQISNFQGPNGVAVSSDEAIAAGAATSRPGAAGAFGGTAAGPAAQQGSSTAAAAARAKMGNQDPAQTIGGSVLDQSGKYSVSNPQVPALDPATLEPPSTGTIESQLNWEASWDEALRSIDSANSDYREAIVNLNDDIRSLAFRLLGDHGRWVELVLLNHLRKPYVAAQSYITANGLTNVIPFGSKILYPVPKVVAQQRQEVWRNETETSLKLSAQERGFGSDIYLDPDTLDAVWTADDLAVSYGINTIGQRIRKRSVMRRGRYRRAIRLGFSDVIGQSNGVIAAVIAAEARGLFVDDDDIVSTQVIDVQQLAQALLIKMAVFVRDLQDPIIVSEQV